MGQQQRRQGGWIGRLERMGQRLRRYSGRSVDYITGNVKNLKERITIKYKIWEEA